MRDGEELVAQDALETADHRVEQAHRRDAVLVS